MTDPVLCINCKMPVHPEARVCPHCGTSPTKVYVSVWETVKTWLKRLVLFYIVLTLIAGALTVYALFHMK